MSRTNAVLTCAVLFSTLLACGSALAADHGVFLGAGVSQSKVDFDANNSRFNGHDTKFKVIAGVRALNWLAVEANYVDFGSIETTTVTQKLKGLDAYVVGLWEVAVVDFFAKAGVVRWDQHIDFTNPSTLDQKSTGYDAAFGGGIQAHMGSLSVRAEYEKFHVASHTNVDLISLGVTWTFL